MMRFESGALFSAVEARTTLVDFLHQNSLESYEKIKIYISMLYHHRRWIIVDSDGCMNLKKIHLAQIWHF